MKGDTKMNTIEKKLETYPEYIRNFIVDNLPNYEGQEVYGCDLASHITDAINIDGSATCSAYLAKQYIREWWDEAADCYEYEKSEYGEVLHNPFEEPEAFHVCMIIHGVEMILTGCEIVDTAWDELITLTEEVITKIVDYVENLTDNDFYDGCGHLNL